MKLKKVAKYFNRTPFSDAYTSENLGRGQLNVYDDNVRDGPTTLRRVFEVTPDMTAPPRGVISFHEENWLIGSRAVDSYNGEVIRAKWIIHKAEELASIHTPKGILQADTPHDAFAGASWVKANAEVEISSWKSNQLTIYLSDTESVEPDQIIEYAGRLHTVLTTYKTSGGFLAATVEQLQDVGLEQVTTEGSTWDPITETYAGGSTVTLLRLRWQSDFEYYSAASQTFQRGDQQIICLKKLANGTRLTLNDGDWVVVSSQSRNDVYYLHLRRDGA